MTLPDTHWFDDEGRRLLALVGRAVHPDGGFGCLDDASELDPPGRSPPGSPPG
ncbi:hypothetical protein [Barrientosiimonas endolithica]|nr:hypothetical protein [Barrientosiimonas endolithica]